MKTKEKISDLVESIHLSDDEVIENLLNLFNKRFNFVSFILGTLCGIILTILILNNLIG